MDFFRLRSNSDLNIQAYERSPIREPRTPPLMGHDESPYGFSAVSLPWGCFDSQPQFDLAAYLKQRSPCNSRYSHDDLLINDEKAMNHPMDVSSESGDFFDAVHVIEAISSIPHLRDGDFKRLSIDRPWETIPIQEVNTLPEEWLPFLVSNDPVQMDLGPYRTLLRFYMNQAFLSNEVYKGCTKHLTATKTQDLIHLAVSLGLIRIVVRLHLEYTNRLEIPIERVAFLLYQRHKHYRNITADSPFSTSTIEYYPGIELKLGKERDTLIRPLLTSIFRDSREPFKAALLEVGLKYGELRMWKDSQLCTAIHVADAFRPGVWDTAAGLHLKKTSKRRLPRRLVNR